MKRRGADVAKGSGGGGRSPRERIAALGTRVEALKKEYIAVRPTGNYARLDQIREQMRKLNDKREIIARLARQ
jgi:hypothetical protein